MIEMTIFKDKSVFSHDYVPEAIVHRSGQTEKIRSILSDTERRTRPRNILCIGTFGTGKTATVRRYCRALTSGIESAYINCSEQVTQYRIIREALRLLGDPVKSGFPGDYYLAAFKTTVERHPWVILVLDEVDKFIERKDSEYNALFYTLSRSVSNVVTIMLTNRIDLEQKLQVLLEPRVKDTFRYELVEFPDYLACELMDILRDRCEIGLTAGSYDEGIVAMMGKKASDLGLRARGLIDSIRKAGEIAEAQGRTAIAEDDVRQAVRELSHEHDMETIQRLPGIQKAILRRVLHDGQPTCTGLYDWFRGELCKVYDVGPSQTRFYDHLGQLQTLGLLDVQTHGRGRGKGRAGRVMIPPDVADMVTRSLDTHPVAEFVTIGTNPLHTPTQTHQTQLSLSIGGQGGVGNRENRHFTNSEMGSSGPPKEAPK